VSIKKAYAAKQLQKKEAFIKELQINQEKLKKKEKLEKKSEDTIKKNLIVKNEQWILEGCMKVLLEDGCDPNVRDNSGETLLIDAIK
jgi:hypothetical protein